MVLERPDAGGDPGDGPLVRRACAGDRTAFEDLVRRHEGWVRNVMVARLGRWGEVEEGVQDTFVRAYTALASLRQPEAFRGWLRTTAERVAVDLGRARPRGGPESEPDPAARPDPSAYEAGERRAAVARAVEALQPDHREVVIMRYDRGMDCREIARDLGISPSAVSMRLARAHEALARDLAGWRTA